MHEFDEVGVCNRSTRARSRSAFSLRPLLIHRFLGTQKTFPATVQTPRLACWPWFSSCARPTRGVRQSLRPHPLRELPEHGRVPARQLLVPGGLGVGAGHGGQVPVQAGWRRCWRRLHGAAVHKDARPARGSALTDEVIAQRAVEPRVWQRARPVQAAEDGWRGQRVGGEGGP